MMARIIDKSEKKLLEDSDIAFMVSINNINKCKFIYLNIGIGGY